MDQNPNKQDRGEEVLQDIKKDYRVATKSHLHRIYTWIAMALVLGVGIGIGYVANMSGQFSSSNAQVAVPDEEEIPLPSFNQFGAQEIFIENRPLSPNQNNEIAYETTLDDRPITITFPDLDTYNSLVAEGGFIFPLSAIKVVFYADDDAFLHFVNGSVLDAWRNSFPNFICGDEVLRGFALTEDESQVLIVSFNFVPEDYASIPNKNAVYKAGILDSILEKIFGPRLWYWHTSDDCPKFSSDCSQSTCTVETYHRTSKEEPWSLFESNDVRCEPIANQIADPDKWSIIERAWHLFGPVLHIATTVSCHCNWAAQTINN